MAELAEVRTSSLHCRNEPSGFDDEAVYTYVVPAE
jgi:hypothetical protein